MSNIRYIELKYNGKVYNQKFEIDEILLENGLNWFLDAEIENARIEIQNKTLIFNAGIIYNCIWEYGVIRDCDARNITFLNGVIYNGIFKRIIVKKGIIFNGTFFKGEILFADIRGGEFKDVNISTNVNQTKINQQVQDIQVQPEDTNQTGQKIQDDLQETLVKKYSDFLNENNVRK